MGLPAGENAEYHDPNSLANAVGCDSSRGRVPPSAAIQSTALPPG